MTAVGDETPARSLSGLLVARTVPLAEPPDLLEVAGDHGLLWRDERGGLAGIGAALRIDLPGGLADAEGVRGAGEALRSIVSDDAVGLPGCGPVAMGALPFDRGAPASLVVPERVVGRLGDRGWVTTIEPDGHGREADEVPEDGKTAGNEGIDGSPLPLEYPEPPDQFTLIPSVPQGAWKALVAEAVSRISAGEFRKVVLARQVEISGNRPFVVSDVLSRLVALYPSCMVFSIEGFIGASPELLIARTGTTISSHPLAGTVARSGDAHADAALVAGLMASGKARREHQVVVDALRTALAPVCAELDVPAEPSVMSLRNVSHLATEITGRLGGGGPETALELVARVHPTPAVGGDPTAVAVRYLQTVEGFDRGRYAGPVGWVDARGDGAWAVGIRCAEVDGPHARIFAGNGVVQGSDPSDELTETQLKLQALLAAMVRP
jgi:menaquinone-specific isochorismate synthase